MSLLLVKRCEMSHFSGRAMPSIAASHADRSAATVAARPDCLPSPSAEGSPAGAGHPPAGPGHSPAARPLLVSAILTVLEDLA